MSTIADYVVARVRRNYPVGGHVVPQSTPVVSFGNHSQARVASVGINPSSHEFQDPSGKLLSVGRKRLPDLEMLEATSPAALSDEAVEVVISSCND